MPDPRKMAIQAPNLAAQPYTSVITSAYPASPFIGSIAAAMPLSNLLTDEPSDRGRITGHDPLYTYFHFGFGYNVVSTFTKTLAMLGLVNVNLSRFGRYRVVGFTSDQSGPEFNRQRIAPDAQLAATNVTGGVTNVDETPHNADGLWAAPTTPGSAWEARYSFPTPAVTPATGSAKQAFVLWVRRQGATTIFHPLIRVELWEGGALKSVLGTRVVTASAGQTLIFRWDAASLTTASGANAEIKVLGSAGTVDSYAQLGAVCWESEHSSYAGDSGWLTSPFDGGSSSWGSTTGDEVGPEPMKNLAHIPAAAWAGIKNWVWLLSDDQADDDASGAYWSATYAPAAAVKSPQGYAEAGVSIAGPFFSPSKVNFGKGPFLSARDPSTAGFTLGGQEHGSRRRPRRVLPVTLPSLTEQEGYDLFERVDWRRGKKLPMLVVKYPDGADATRRLTTVWATLEEMAGLSIASAFQRHVWSGVFVEKL